MKPVVLLLAGSAVANLVLIGVLATRSSPADPPDPTPASEIASQTGALAPATNSAIDTVTWRARHDDDLATFAANLRTAGFADHVIRAIISAEIDERFRAREEALAPPRPLLPYWQLDTYRPPLETRLALLDLKREKARMRLAILGPDEPALDDDGIIPADKREIARMISEDYDTVIKDLRLTTGRMPLPAEAAMLAALEEDKQRELATYLTPEELAEFEIRTSPGRQNLRRLGSLRPQRDSATAAAVISIRADH